MTLFRLKSSCFTSLDSSNNRSSLSDTNHYCNKDQRFCHSHIYYGDALESVGKSSRPLLDELIDICQKNATACERRVSSLPIQCDLALMRESSLHYLQWSNLPTEKLNIHPCGKENFVRRVIEAGDISEHHVAILSNCHAVLSDRNSPFLPVNALPSTFRVPSRSNSCKMIRRRRADGYHNHSICSIEDLEEGVVSFNYSRATETLREHAIGHQEQFGLCSSEMFVCLVVSLLVVLTTFIVRRKLQSSFGDKMPASSTCDTLMARNRTKRRRENIGSGGSSERPLFKKKLTGNSLDDCTLSNAEIPIRYVSSAAVLPISDVGSSDDRTFALYNTANHVVESSTTDASFSDAFHRSTSAMVWHRTSTNDIIDQYQQRWESRGLDHHTSLLLAATFDMMLCICRLWSQSLYSMYFETYSQEERHHQERMESPLFEKIKSLRKEIIYLPFNSTLLILAIASKHSWVLRQQSLLMSVHDALFSTVCSSCMIPRIEVYEQFINYFSSLQVWSAFTLIYRGVQSADMIWCVGKVIFLATFGALILFRLHHIVPQQVIVAILGLIMWRSIIQLSIAVMTVNIFLSFLVRRISDETGTRLDVREKENHYEQCFTVGQVLLWCSSVCVGYCFS